MRPPSLIERKITVKVPMSPKEFEELIAGTLRQFGDEDGEFLVVDMDGGSLENAFVQTMHFVPDDGPDGWAVEFGFGGEDDFPRILRLETETAEEAIAVMKSVLADGLTPAAPGWIEETANILLHQESLKDRVSRGAATLGLPDGEARKILETLFDPGATPLDGLAKVRQELREAAFVRQEWLARKGARRLAAEAVALGFRASDDPDLAWELAHALFSAEGTLRPLHETGLSLDSNRNGEVLYESLSLQAAGLVRAGGSFLRACRAAASLAREARERNGFPPGNTGFWSAAAGKRLDRVLLLSAREEDPEASDEVELLVRGRLVFDFEGTLLRADAPEILFADSEALAGASAQDISPRFPLSVGKKLAFAFFSCDEEELGDDLEPASVTPCCRLALEGGAVIAIAGAGGAMRLSEASESLTPLRVMPGGEIASCETFDLSTRWAAYGIDPEAPLARDALLQVRGLKKHIKARWKTHRFRKANGNPPGWKSAFDADPCSEAGKFLREAVNEWMSQPASLERKKEGRRLSSLCRTPWSRPCSLFQGLGEAQCYFLGIRPTGPSVGRSWKQGLRLRNPLSRANGCARYLGLSVAFIEPCGPED